MPTGKERPCSRWNCPLERKEKKVKFDPVGDNVIISRELLKVQDGIALPEESWTYKMVGTVVAVGPGQHRMFPDPENPKSTRMPMQVKVGDKVLCPLNTTIIPADPFNPKRHENLFYCREGMLTAVLKPDDVGSNGKAK